MSDIINRRLTHPVGKRFSNRVGFTPLEMSKTRSEKAKSLTGFTLIEIVIALLVLTIGLVGVLALFPVGFEASSRSINTTVAAFLAQELLEDAKLAGYDGVDGMTTTSGTWDAPYDNYEYTFGVTANIDGLDLKQVDVEVFWPAGATTQKHISFTTYIAKYEP